MSVPDSEPDVDPSASGDLTRELRVILARAPWGRAVVGTALHAELSTALANAGVHVAVRPYVYEVFTSGALRLLCDVRREGRRDRIRDELTALEEQYPDLVAEHELSLERDDALPDRWWGLHHELAKLEPIPTDLLRIWYCLVSLADGDLRVEGIYERVRAKLKMKDPQITRALNRLVQLGFVSKDRRRNSHAQIGCSLVVPVT
jgi:hypothetical protein